MPRYATSKWWLVLRPIPWLVLSILLVYIYGVLFGTPYAGFTWLPNGKVENVFASSPAGGDLQVGDEILQIGSVRMADYVKDYSLRLSSEFSPGQATNLKILRAGRELDIHWISPTINAREFRFRFFGPWWVGVAFFLAGTATWVIVRPRDVPWALFVAITYITAIAIVAGNISIWRFVESHLVMRSALWLSIPLNLHFHWVFPKSLRKIPIPLVMLFYLLAFALVTAEWLGLLPTNAYAFGVPLLGAGIISLLIAQVIQSPENRRDLFILISVIIISFLPPITLSLTRLISLFPADEIPLLILSLFFIPAAYLYIFVKRNMGGLETRANQAISIYLFTIGILTAGIVVFSVSDALELGPGLMFSVRTGLIVFAGFLGIVGYPSFERWIHRHFLNITLPPDTLVGTFASRLSTTLETESLSSIWQEEILPSLLIRQAALLRFEGDHLNTIFSTGIAPDQMPSAKMIPHLLAQSGVYRVPPHVEGPAGWIRLVLTMREVGQPVGLLLLGRRDPNDYYAPPEIPVLQALADQTSLALLSIDQANRLRALYQADIERHEVEQNRLALELHDDVLQHMALLYNIGAELGADEQFHTAYQSSVAHIRDIISGLRPNMLMYGLRAALAELIEEDITQIGLRPNSDTGEGEDASGRGLLELKLDIPVSTVRYPEDVELHLYRIVQQSCQNAVKHAKASQITIRGCLEVHSIELEVEDDGVGFEIRGKSDLARWLADQHFGLAAIHERAALIGAQVQIDSAPGKGTRVRLRWQDNPAHPDVQFKPGSQTFTSS